MTHIPFNRVSLLGQELAYIQQAIDAGHVSGDGLFTRKCHALLEQSLGVHKVLLTTSGTHALDIAAMLLDLGTGDEVITPSFTFVSTVNAFVLRGARPVFVDVRADTLNLDETLIERAITPRTKALVAVHYAGVGCEMDRITAIAASHGLAVVEDNAHGLFATYRGRLLGTFGVLSALSFHETKNFTCGEGGALVINDAKYIERAEIVREKGTDRSRFFRGQVDKYTWVDVGSSFLPSDILAAFLYAQLEARATIQAKRRALWERYARDLADWSLRQGIRLPVVPEQCEQSYHMFYLLARDLGQRDALIQYLKSRDIIAVFHYVPLHLSKMGARFGGRAGMCPVTESMSDRLVRLPFFTGITEAETSRVIEALLTFGG